MNKKRMFALALSLVMCLSLLPAGALATGEEEADQNVEVTETEVKVPENKEGVTDIKEGVTENEGEDTKTEEGTKNEDAQTEDTDAGSEDKNAELTDVGESEPTATKLPDAQDGVITLTGNVTATLTVQKNETVTLDLKGFTLTNEAGKHTIINKGTLTIQDSSQGKTGTVDNINHGKGAVYNDAGATCTILSGQFTRSKENGKNAQNSGDNSWYVIKNFGTMTIGQENGSDEDIKVFFDGAYSSLVANGWQAGANAGKGSEPAYSADASLTIHNGTFNKGLNTIKNDDYGQLIINGGTYENNYQAVVQNHNVAAINGGTFTAAADASLTTYGVDNCGCNATYDKGTLTISGGSFSGSNYAVRDRSSVAGTVTISNGSFDGTTAAVAQKAETKGTISITGGTFSSDVIQYTPVGRTTAKRDGKYVVEELSEANAAAKIGNAIYKTLPEAIAAATEGAEVTLLKDVSLSSQVTVKKKLTLDLAGHDITFSNSYGFVVRSNGNLNLTGEGTIKANYNPLYMEGAATDDKTTCVATVGKDVTISAPAGDTYAVTIFQKDTDGKTGDSSYGVDLTVHGTLDADAGIFVLGNIKKSDGPIPKVRLTETAVVKGTTIGMAINGLADVTIDGATVMGTDEKTGTGIEIRAGKLTVNSGTITGKGAPTTVTPNGNGTTSTGVGIAVAQHTTTLPITVNINKGEISGYSALYESTPQNNSNPELITLSVSGGNFQTTKDGTAAVYSQNFTAANKKGFITGGTFSDLSVIPYLAEGAKVDVKLDKPVTLNKPVDITQDLTVDLNGQTITGTDTRVFNVKKGTLTLTNSNTTNVGKVESTYASSLAEDSSVIRVGDGKDAAASDSQVDAKLVIDKGVTVATDRCYGVTVFGSATKETVIVKGNIEVTGKAAALSGNGTKSDPGDGGVYAGTVITIENGAKVSSEKTSAIYHPQDGTLTVNGGEIIGYIGIAVRSGQVTVNDGTITAKGTENIAEGSATHPIAPAAIVLDASTKYPGVADANVKVNGGKLTGGGTEKLALKYYPKEGEEEKKAPFTVSGGNFSSDVSEYLTSGKRLSKNADGTWSVYTPSSGGGTTTPPTTSTTEKNEDGSTTTTVTDNRTGTVTETTKAPDGTTTQVETQKDGTVTTTETTPDGSTATVVEKPDGSSQVEVKQADGTTATVVTDTQGNTQAQVEVSDKAVTAAAEEEKPVALPIPAVEAATTTQAAPKVEVSLPKSAEAVSVEIPVTQVTPGTVAVIVHADGTEEIIKTSLPTEAGVALTLDGSATVKIVDNTKPFDDLVEEHWAKDSVDFVAARELFQGTAATTFAPEEPMTRAMLITVLARVDDVEAADEETWYGGALDWAVETGITDGSNLNGAITREQLATMLYRYFGQPEPSADLSTFVDAGSLSPFADNAMRWAVEVGLINGLGNGILDPHGQATRAQVAAIMERCLKLK